jgi:hypothetical protein
MLTHEPVNCNGRLRAPLPVTVDGVEFTAHGCTDADCDGWIVYLTPDSARWNPELVGMDLNGIFASSYSLARIIRERITDWKDSTMTHDPDPDLEALLDHQDRTNEQRLEQDWDAQRRLDVIQRSSVTTADRLKVTLSVEVAQSEGATERQINAVERLVDSIRERLAYLDYPVQVSFDVSRTTATDIHYDTEPF